jgi:tetratricopeptide (TPR) repeat protein
MLNRWDWKTAEKEFLLAIEESPNYATAHHWHAENLAYQGKFKLALEEISRAVALDPLSPAAMKDLGLIQYYARDYEASIESATKAIELNPNFPSAHRLLSLAYQAQGKFEEAMAEHDRWAEGAELGFEENAARAQCLAAAGRAVEARELVKALPPREDALGNLARAVGLIYVALGDHDQAFSWLERALETGAESLGTLKVDPKVDPIRSDPRFAALLARVGLAPERS